MTEDIARFRSKDEPWRLSGRDAEVLADLIVVLRFWLPAFKTAAEITDVARAIADIEELAASGRAPQECRIDMERLDPFDGGLSAAVSLSSFDISLELMEWVPCVNGGLDYGGVVDGDGRLVGMRLDHMGSYDRDDFDAWWHKAMECGPQDPNDPGSKGDVERETTTGHSAPGFHE